MGIEMEVGKEMVIKASAFRRLLESCRLQGASSLPPEPLFILRLPAPYWGG